MEEFGAELGKEALKEVVKERKIKKAEQHAVLLLQSNRPRVIIFPNEPPFLSEG